MKTRKFGPSFIAVAAVVSACGAPAADDQAAEQDDDGQVEVAERLPEVAPLAMALDAAGESSAYRAELALGMTMDVAALGQSMSFEPDPAAPMITMEVDADGEQYVLTDMAPMMTAMLGEAAPMAEQLFGGDLSMETWQSGTTIVMDLNGFGSMLGQVSADSSVFPDEMFSVDLARLGDEIGSEEIAAAMSGQAAPDPVEMVRVLSAAIGDAVSIDPESSRFTGELTFAQYSEAFGQDADAMLGGMDAAFEELGGPDAIAGLIDVMNEITVDVEVALADGAVDTVRFDVDMSSIWTALPALMGDQIPDAELAEIESLFDGATFEMTMLMDYDLDPNVDVVMPSGNFVDGTDAFIDVFGSAFGA